MDVGNGNMLGILNRAIQFVLPKYQRHYSWEKEQCAQLWDDLVKVQKGNRNGHFIGSIVSIFEASNPTGVQKFTLIDGQQRMATLTLILIALRDYLLDHLDIETVNVGKIENNQLKNPYENNTDCYKLLLTGHDRQILIDLVDKKKIPEDTSSRLIINYKFFAEKISEGELTPSEIYEAIGKLNLVSITLTPQKDNAQAIFESLNSTGKDLSQSDLIRNFVLMGLDNRTQNEIYDKFWLPMENLFGNNDNEKIMDSFFRDYLTMKLSRIPNEDRVYDEFKAWYFRSGFENKISELCAELLCNAEYYTNIIFARSSDEKIKTLYDEIKNLKMEVSYPFLLKIHEDLQKKLITSDDLIEILKLCISYIVRRYVCEIPSAGLNKTFAAFRNDDEFDISNYMRSLKDTWAKMEGSKEFPNDEKFREAFILQNIYKNTKRCYYILGRLENFENRALIIPQNFTIEHIMPQNKNLSQEWQNELGSKWRDIQKLYLHTVGNLTLTAYNSELGDKPFSEKLNMKGGYIESGLRLNSFIRRQTHWNEEKIKQRAEELADKALKIWQYPAEADKTSVQTVEPENTRVKPQPIDAIDFKTKIFDKYQPTKQAWELLEPLNHRIKNLSDEVVCEFKTTYVAYKIEGINFADVVIQRRQLKIVVNMKFREVIDPLRLCRDVSNIGKNGNGEAEIKFENISQLGAIMDIIEQSYEKRLK